MNSEFIPIFVASKLNLTYNDMNNMNELAIITTKDVEDKLIVLRSQEVLLDCDVAELYGVKTKEVNQAVKNNPEKFPYGYIFVLDKYEKAEVVKNFDRLNKLKYSTVEPTVFTQRGLYMLATIIKSPRATSTTIAIVDTFVTVRELANTMEQIQNTEDGGAQQKKLLQQSGKLMANMIGNNLSTTAAETEIELNFAVVKIKHKIIRKDGK